MAGIEITITGLLYEKLNRTTQNVVLIGEATYTGLTVGGGPVYPPPVGGGAPPHPEHPIPPRPEHPIVLPPDPGWPGGEPHPEHPIVLPPPNMPGPPEGGAGKPPPPGGGWGWHPEYGWGYFPGSGGKPQPPA